MIDITSVSGLPPVRELETYRLRVAEYRMTRHADSLDVAQHARLKQIRRELIRRLAR